MKDLPLGLRTSLDSGVTMLCWCWRVTRRDGTRMGFTDHDRDVVFDATTFEAAAGLSASEINESVGLGVDNLEVSGALTSERLTEADLAAGFYDDAAVEVFRVDWSAPENRILMRTGSLGEVSRAGRIFKAEVRGLAHYLQQPKGRLYQYTCDADLGDNRCKVNLDAAAYRSSGTVVEFLTPRKFTASGLNAFANDFFSRGLLDFTSGPALGQKLEVKVHVKRDGVVSVECWEPVRNPLQPGSGFDVRAGCDKIFATCRAKFDNAINFRGFPHIPGNDFIASHATRPGTRR
ncbi:MAG: beta tubulin [Alphaproteobacteria bacterium BRH_c36]|nr:MAG: beta tubulin [Alphaproteobacteria bacterium BRH_c36]